MVYCLFGYVLSRVLHPNSYLFGRVRKRFYRVYNLFGHMHPQGGGCRLSSVSGLWALSA